MKGLDFRKQFIWALAIFSSCLTGVFLFVPAVQADFLGQQVDFYVNSDYDLFGREEITATLRAMGQQAYFYVEDDYWQDLSLSQRSAAINSLASLAEEFDTVIYPRERSVFGSEWRPGIDNDSRITILITQLTHQAAGYFNSQDEYPRSEVPASNQREMVYLNSLHLVDKLNKAFLAHEFQHLITFYQKTKLFGLEEEVWLNEARSEYAPTLCGYDRDYANSYLANRVDIFLDHPSDSLTEWKNNSEDYGVTNLFMHYLVGRFGQEILTQMTLNNQIGIASINQALADLGYQITFADVFADWAIASYLNDCQVSSDYCYNNEQLTYTRLHLKPTASYSGFPNLIVSRSSSLKDWAAYWYRFRQGSPIETERDTFKLVIKGSAQRGDFQVPYIVFDQNNQPKIHFVSLVDQKGVIYIPHFSSQNKSVVILPFNRYKKKGFTDNEPLSSFSFTATSIEANLPIIESLSPSSGLINSQLEVSLKGSNLGQVARIVLGNQNVTGFKLISDEEIRFSLPPSTQNGPVDLIVYTADGQSVSLSKAFTYLKGYPDGSLIRARGDYKVYIVKGSYRRWIQRPDIFNFYGHLNWAQVIEVSPQERDSYQEVSLVRALNDPRVYQVDQQGVKHWLNMTAEEFVQSGRQWSMVYIINSAERNFYQNGSDIFFR